MLREEAGFQKKDAFTVTPVAFGRAIQIETPNWKCFGNTRLDFMRSGAKEVDPPEHMQRFRLKQWEK